MSTIKSTRDIDTIFRGARRFAHPLVIALVMSTPEGRGHEGRVAFVAGKKLGNAVRRNRSKRVMRAAVRRAGGSWNGKDIVFIARPTTGDASPEALDAALTSVLGKSGAL